MNQNSNNSSDLPILQDYSSGLIVLAYLRSVPFESGLIISRLAEEDFNSAQIICLDNYGENFGSEDLRKRVEEYLNGLEKLTLVLDFPLNSPDTNCPSMNYFPDFGALDFRKKLDREFWRNNPNNKFPRRSLVNRVPLNFGCKKTRGRV